MNVGNKLVCLGILDFLKEKHAQLYAFFSGPALAVLAPSLAAKYQQLIQKPRDLEMIRLKAQQDMYSSMGDFAEDVRLCFANAKLFCSKYKEFKGVYDASLVIVKHFNKKYEFELKSAQKMGKGGKGKGSTRLSMPSGAASSGTGSGTRGATSVRQTIADYQSSLAEKVVKPLKVEQGAAIISSPVSPHVEFYQVYTARIRRPMDLDTVIKKLLPPPKPNVPKKDRLSQGSPVQNQEQKLQPYVYIDEFTADMRSVFANAIRYNCHPDKMSVSVRRNVTAIAVKFESRFLDWNKKNFPARPLSPPLPEMRVWLAALESAFRVTSRMPDAPADTPAVVSFIDPINIQLSGDVLKAYCSEIAAPVDYGTIVSRVLGADLDARYESVRDFLGDVQLVTHNCRKYWSHRMGEGGKHYIEDAERLQSAVEQRLNCVDREGPPLLPSLPLHIASPPAEPTPAIGKKNKRDSISGGGGASLSFSLKRNSMGVGSSSSVPAASTSRQSLPASFALDSSTLQVASLDDHEHSTFREVSPLEKVHFYLPSTMPEGHESSHQLERRANKYLAALLVGIIEEQMPKHYMKGPNGLRIPTCNPFVQKVDQRIFPEYGKFLHAENRDEVYLQLVVQKVRRGEYGSSMMAALVDVRKLRDNAHAFNIGDENIETRIMADCVLHYFSYCLKTCLTAMLNCRDVALRQYCMTAENMRILDEPTAEDVLNFLQVQTDDAREQWQKMRDEEATKKASAAAAAAALLEPVVPLGAIEDGHLLYDADGYPIDVDGMPGAMPIEDDSFFDMDLDLSNFGLPTNTPVYQGHLQGGNAAKGKGKAKIAAGGGAAWAPAHVKTEWELAATAALNKICRHPFVDMSSRPGTSLLIADFFRPVTETYPHLAEEYAAVVKAPIDLSQVGDELNRGLLLDPEDFHDKLTRVFLNLVAYNEREGLSDHQKQFAKEMVIKGNHLARWAKWLCLENLPLKGAALEQQHEKPELLGELRESVLEQQRKAREELVLPAPLLPSLVDVKKLLTNLKKTKGKPEAILMGWFCVPPVQPSDYAVYVRKPMDLGTIQQRLDKKPTDYRTYSEVIGDMRLVFQNSIKYNAVHMAKDEGSKQVHDAAHGFLRKLEDLMPQFTLETAERVERQRLTDVSYQRLEVENYQRRLKEAQELSAFEESEKQKRLAEDKAFREDLDIEKKKEKSLIDAKAYEEAQSKLRAELADQEDLGYENEDMESKRHVLADEDTLRCAAMRLQGIGTDGVPPAHLLPYMDQIVAVRAAVWNLCVPWANTGSNANDNAVATIGQKRERSALSPAVHATAMDVMSPSFQSPSGGSQRGWQRSQENTPSSVDRMASGGSSSHSVTSPLADHQQVRRQMDGTTTAATTSSTSASNHNMELKLLVDDSERQRPKLKALEFF